MKIKFINFVHTAKRYEHEAEEEKLKNVTIDGEN
jgi:hypothetical protein